LKRADFVAGEADELFGARPQACRSLEEAISGIPELELVVQTSVNGTFIRKLNAPTTRSIRSN